MKHQSATSEESLLYDLSEPLLHLLTEAGVPLQQPPPSVHPLLLAHTPLPLQDGGQFIPVTDEDEGCSSSFQQTQRRAGPGCTSPRGQDVLHHRH